MNEIEKAREKRLAERNSIHALEDLMMGMPEEEKVDIDSITEHFFAPGVYARMVFLKKGNVAVGKIHKTDHLNIICQGMVSVSTEDGPMMLKGPCVFVARAGVKKAVYAIEDTTWINVHVTNETDLNKIEDTFIAKDYDEIEYKEE
jgi:quercetin dioxygenase-like cupin family protein